MQQLGAALRIGIALSFAHHPVQRSRQVAIAVSAALATVAVLVGPAWLGARERMVGRAEARAPVFAPAETPAAVGIRQTNAWWDGRPYTQVWIGALTSGGQRRTSGDPPLPPGLPRIPEPGEAFLSPALVEALNQDPELQRRYPRWWPLAREGVRHSDELLAYVGVDAEAVPLLPVVAFGVPATGGSDPFAQKSLPSVRETVSLWVTFLLVPALVALTVSVSLGSSLRDTRLTILSWLGATRLVIALVAAAEVLPAALLGGSAGAFGWTMLAPRISSVPMLEADPLPGDLNTPTRHAVAAVGLIATLASVSVAAMAAQSQLRDTSFTRPYSGWSRIEWLRVLALLPGSALALARWQAREVAELLDLFAMLCFAMAAPLVTPLVLRFAGQAIPRLPTLWALLAGRRVAFDPARHARPFAALSLLLALGLLLIGFWIRSQPPAVGAPSVALSAALLPIPDPRAVADIVRAELPGTVAAAPVAVPLPQRRADGGVESAGWVAMDCTAIRHVGVACEYGAPRDELATIVAALNPAGAETTVIPFEEAPASASRGLLLVGPASADVPSLASTVLTRFVPGNTLNVLLPKRASRRVVNWLLAPAAGALVILTLASGFSVADRLLSSGREWRRLVALGMREETIRHVETLANSLALLLVIIAGTGVGAASLWLVVGNGPEPAPVPWRSVVLLVVIVATAGLMLCAVVGFAGPKLHEVLPEE